MKTILAAIPLALAGSLLVAAPASADDRVCRGTIGSKLIDGDVVVPKGASCTLLGTRVDGNVLVKGNATLVARGVKVDGNIQAGNHRRVVVTARDGSKSRVEGSVQLKQGGGGTLLGMVVNGDIQLFSNDARFTVRGNRVDGNLQCKSNRPKPIGGNNVVEGNKEDQCRGL